MGATRALASVSLAACMLAAGCFHPIDRHCRGCVIVPHDSPDPPLTPAGKRGLVVLVHGINGFGAEWTPIRVALAARPELAWFAFAWPGPFGGRPPNAGEALRATLQLALARLPASARDVLVLAHSAGGPVADYSARRLVVPPGVRVEVALIDPARTSLAPYTPVDPIATPLDQGSAPPPPVELPAVPDGVVLREYRAQALTSRLLRAFDRARPRQNGGHDTSKERFLLDAKTTHGEAVSVAGLPLIERLGQVVPARAEPSEPGTSRPR